MDQSTWRMLTLSQDSEEWGRRILQTRRGTWWYNNRAMAGPANHHSVTDPSCECVWNQQAIFSQTKLLFINFLRSVETLRFIVRFRIRLTLTLIPSLCQYQLEIPTCLFNFFSFFFILAYSARWTNVLRRLVHLSSTHSVYTQNQALVFNVFKGNH